MVEILLTKSVFVHTETASKFHLIGLICKYGCSLSQLNLAVHDNWLEMKERLLYYSTITVARRSLVVMTVSYY
jgi:hypothetical protein